MTRRIFIAINLPSETKKAILDYQKKWLLPIRWTREENLHITLAFLGYLDDGQLLETIKTAEAVIEKHQPFKIQFKRICYGPPKKMPPRMVWLEIQPSSELSALQQDFEDKLFGLPSFQHKEKEMRPFSPHITLGRIKTWEFRRLDPEEMPVVNEDVDLSFGAASVEVMESELKRGGAEYHILQSIPLTKQNSQFEL